MTPATMRPELEPLPERMKDLPVDHRGYVVPWFVAWIDGPDGSKIPEFRAVGKDKMSIAHRHKLCWVCGKKLGSFVCFVIGPMCGINRISSEPPSHVECAQWSARNCPFLSRPHMVRREDELTESLWDNTAGVGLKRNPGVTLLWITRWYRVIDDGTGKALFRIGDPERMEWYAEGRAATRAEIDHSVTTGLPLLENVARLQHGGMEALNQAKAVFERLLPAEVLA